MNINEMTKEISSQAYARSNICINELKHVPEHMKRFILEKHFLEMATQTLLIDKKRIETFMKETENVK